MISKQSSINDAAISIKEFIDANPLNKLSATELAAKFRVNRYKVLPIFKHLTGATIQHYKLKKCMEEAGNMLLSGMTVKEAAIECGYQEYHNNFTRSFKKVYTIGPEEWVKKNLIEKKNQL
ncbi:helix-turn-helix domain-containing protein [Longitalea arenae]|uniref:helix-turn-helix domain-containing protein n=1 Tax=Longitalea arenae TaxID=2812558 RepID=UPI0019673523|nr:AraC family transcriptional regulator [Longitalea arenae]